MASEIISFGSRHGSPPSGSILIDIRTIIRKNPFHNKKLRSLRGDDEAVIRDMERTPNLEDDYQRLLKTVNAAPGAIYIGCTGGHHRSVYLANRLAKDLGVPVSHRDYNKR